MLEGGLFLRGLRGLALPSDGGNMEWEAPILNRYCACGFMIVFLIPGMLLPASRILSV